MEKINLFISYSHLDKPYLVELKQYINEMSCPKLAIWDDFRIEPGQQWDAEIKRKLNQADIILLLVSQAFLSSNYINLTEFKVALERHKDNLCRIVPIYIKSCDLASHKQITQFQGLPEDKRFISDMDDEKYHHYTVIQQKIKNLADNILTERNISESIRIADDNSDTANQIEKLRNRKKIFLSLPEDEEGKKQRNTFLYQIEGKIKYEDWPYEIVPGIAEAAEAYEKDPAGLKDFLLGFINQSIYSIHIVSTEASLDSNLGRIQYELAVKKQSGQEPFKNIIWLLKPEIKAGLSKEIAMNPIVNGHDYESIFETIKSFDVEKEKKIEHLKKGFSSEKKVFMFYDFEKDHENDLRIKLKTTIEESEHLSVWFSGPNAPLEKDRDDLEKCDGGCIFYGAADTQWFAMRQIILRDANKTKSKAVCIGEPEIKMKMERDVMRNGFITIGGNPELELKVREFLNNL